ncbi:sigma-70 family RNA polymerase sigma factor [Parerythrobacter jejuensis]|uniref:Sigma-70 family RNA polymerase sigma factor n=1 Tax=Parerythrobacter jejuensis TaxID=795812 RepID=A0A845ALU8_9SPHN|nr:sigma-70 family RNA polymerase sigma factor [Parerythrobacter jejuensis]MXP30584.1 sigma-70 family RNA polymerase sigma factor [Parerythrobacter jejuensis]MXP33344.1 sigma-70 family RNA polymerase sigma factor [Parerythrobacter jejuensis]
MKHDSSGFAAAQAYASPAEVEERVRRFVPMVRRAAWHIFGVGRDGLEVEDLIQSGMIALTECARRHNGPTEDGFAAYAKMRVRGAMFDLVRKAMPDSRTVVQKRRRYEAAMDVLTGQLGYPPSPAQTAEKLGCSVEELRAIEASQTRLSSIEESYDEANCAFADDTPDPFQMLAAMDDRERLIEAMRALPERLQLVLQLFFVEELNLTEIAEILEVSVPRVHQLRSQALGKLKAMLEEEPAN